MKTLLVLAMVAMVMVCCIDGLPKSKVKGTLNKTEKAQLVQLLKELAAKLKKSATKLDHEVTDDRHMEKKSWFSPLLGHESAGSPACSGSPTELTGPSGEFGISKSQYKNRAHCGWKIRVESGKLVHLHFTAFDVETNWFSSRCTRDTVKIYDGASPSAPRLGMYCGTHLPGDITSSGNTLFVSFTSDYIFTKDGFHVKYYAIGHGSAGSPACSGSPTELTGPSGEFGISKSQYKNRAKCGWKIRVKSGKLVHLHFTAFDVETNWFSSRCTRDNVKIYDGASPSAPRLGTYCGTHLPGDITSSGNTLFVSSTSDYSFTRDGFHVKYYAIGDQSDGSPACSGSPAELTGPSGEFGISQSQYKNDAQCGWKITVKSGKLVHLHFTAFDIESAVYSFRCPYDSVKINDGASPSAPLLGTYCGTHSPGDITSSGNTLFVSFTSDSAKTKGGFHVTYNAKSIGGGPQCGMPAITPTFTRIVGGSPARPHSWPWQISLLFHNFHICGGSIIRKNWVVTAAHCVIKHLNNPSVFEVEVGKHKLGQRKTTESRHKVAKIFMHAGYSKLTHDNDIALLKLSTAISFTREVSPVCLPTRDVWGTMCVTTGWGLTQGTGDRKTLNQVRVPLVNPTTCNQPTWYHNALTDRMVCAGYEEGGKGSCQGDSGGPLVCRADGGGPWMLQGITSFGTKICANKPGVYARVTAFVEWIDSTISGERGL